MAITIQGIDHVVIRTSDVASMVAFYEGVLGCAVERNVERLGLLQLRAGTSLIDLVDTSGELGKAGGTPPGPEGRNMDHFCLRVLPWDETAIREHLRQAGIDAGETASRYGAEGQGPSIYLEDPDGNVVELKGPPDS